MKDNIEQRPGIPKDTAYVDCWGKNFPGREAECTETLSPGSFLPASYSSHYYQPWIPIY
jgi:hypothetical protein